MIKTNLFSLLIFLSVLCFAHRIFQIFRQKKLLEKKLLTKIGTLQICFLFLSYQQFFLRPFHLWISSILVLCFVPIVIFVIRKNQQRQFQSEFLRFLSQLVLQMQMGHSWQTSFQKTLRENTWRQGFLLQQIYENVAFSPQADFGKSGPFAEFLKRIRNELIYVHKHQHLAIDRLCNLQKNLRTEFYFRRKSGQIWTYFAYQLGLLSVLFWGIFIFTLFHQGWKEHSEVFLVSFLFYGMGFLIVFIMLKGKKWEI